MRTWIIFFFLACPLIVNAKDLNDVNGRYESKNNHYQSQEDNLSLSMLIKTRPNSRLIEISIKGDGMPSVTGFAWLCDFSGTGKLEGNVIKAYHEDQKEPLLVTLSDQGAEVSGKKLWHYCGIGGSLEGQYRKVLSKRLTYVGGGFTITVKGTGLNAQYTACDSKNQCLTLKKPVRYSDRDYTWENNGYQYMMNPVGSTQCQLSAINPKGKKIVKQTLQAK
jgi:hypothetical protein